jgi:hypothetical protein
MDSAVSNIRHINTTILHGKQRKGYLTGMSEISSKVVKGRPLFIFTTEKIHK